MENKLSKILIILIFLIIGSLFLTNNVNATVDIDGKTYYTKDDVHWRGRSGWGYIEVDGIGKFYCINHNYTLTKYLTKHDRDITDTPTASMNSKSNISENQAIYFLNQNIRDKVRGTIWENGGTARALRLYPQAPINIRNNNQAALYAFADKYYDAKNNPSGYVQNAVWEYISKDPTSGQNYSNYAHTSLYDAAMQYETWIRNNKSNLSSNSSNAKARIIGSDYIVGPFNINYNEATYERIKYSELYSYRITDQNGNVVGAQITDSNGTPMGGVVPPNHQDFYIKFPYSESMTKINMDLTVKEINEVWATYADILTTYQKFKLEWTSHVVNSYYYIRHNQGCPKFSRYPGGVEENVNPNITGCEECEQDTKPGYSYWATSSIKKSGGEVSGSYQNMRSISGDLSYSYATTHLEAPLAHIQKEMDLAGYVWEDGEQGKDQTINGSLDSGEKRLAGIEVRLYRVDTGTLAEVNKGTNPTVTDGNGYYEFKGVNPTYKYMVVFTYDGMLYTNTYGAGIPEYNTEAWNISSKGSELVNERNGLNNKFVTISSTPLMYKTNAIFGGGYLVNGYNKIFSADDSRVIDYKNRIENQLRSYLAGNKRLEDGNYLSTIYGAVLSSSGGSTEAKQILQYIWDCRINSYAGYESERDGKTSAAGGKFYPVYDRFALLDNNGNRITANNSTTTWQGYRIIYNGQLHINLGLVKRPTTDLQLDEDLYRTVVSLNGQDETYNYGTFDKRGVKVNVADAQGNISQNIATSDYDYKIDTTALSSALTGTAMYPKDYAPIQMYITYRINVRNNSNIPAGINEIVTYIDSKYYSYSDTYTTTGGVTLKGIEGSFIYPNSATTYDEKNLTAYDAGAFGLKVNTHSKYGIESETGKNLSIKGEAVGTDLYISFDRNVILEQNQALALYITYRLGETSTKDAKFNCTYNSTQVGGANHAYAILQDLFRNTDNKKITVYTGSEINAYSTFFKKDFDVGGTQSKYSSFYSYTTALSAGSTYRAAGVFDVNSMPGNLDQAEINKYDNSRTKTDNDWDRASGFVIMDGGGQRELIGNVWETVGEPANYWANNGDYPKFNNAYVAEGITVELIEIKNGIEYVRAKTTTDGNGAYRFAEYIPGLYTVRFIYGDSAKYDTTQYSKYTNFTLNDDSYKCAYNGEFYQSAKANPKTNDNQYWYAVEEGDRYSDASDEVTIRKAINESLQTYKYNDVTSLLKHATDYIAYAYTSVLDVEVEKAKTETNTQNPAYTISNVDFALTPRTESKLEINKEVTHIKLILQNGAVQFDADTKTIREQGVPAVVQAAQGNDITISMSSELVNGATLEITYTITVTNVGPEDTVTYYKDPNGQIIALGLYKENPANIVYYEDGLIRTYNNSGTFQRNTDGTWVSKIEAGNTTMKNINTNKTETIETTTRADLVADFVSNNLNFAKVDYTGATINNGWDLYTGTKKEFENEFYKQKQDSGELALKPETTEMEEQAKDIYDSNMIVISNNNNALVTTNLKHSESVSENIVLSKIISVNDDSTDTKSYTNKARIVRVNNTVSRVQDMGDPKLTHTSEHVIVSDPTGIGNIYLGILLTLIVAAVIGGGVVLIRRYVIK